MVKANFKAAVAALAIAASAVLATSTSAHASAVGTFRLKNLGWGNYCLSANGGSNSTTVIAACATSGDAYKKQAWTIYPVSNGGYDTSVPYFQVVNVATGLCLGASDDKLTGGAPVGIVPCDTSLVERWGFNMNTNYNQHVKNLDAYSISFNSRFLLDMNQDHQRLWANTGNNNQYWSWVP